MGPNEFLTLLRQSGFHIGDGIDDCAGTDETEELAQAEIVLDKVSDALLSIYDGSRTT